MPVPDFMEQAFVDFLADSGGLPAFGFNVADAINAWIDSEFNRREAQRQLEANIQAQDAANFQAFLVSPTGQFSASCGDHYEPEQAVNHEVGFALTFENLIRDTDRLFAKFTYYDTRVSNLIESIYQDAVTLEVDQPGIEVRKGYEFEFHYDHPILFCRL